MKKTVKFLSLLLAVSLIMSLAPAVFAVTVTEGTAKSTLVFSEDFSGNTFPTAKVKLQQAQFFAVSAGLTTRNTDDYAVQLTASAGGNPLGGKSGISMNLDSEIKSNLLEFSYDVKFNTIPQNTTGTSVDIMSPMIAHGAIGSNRWSYANVFSFKDNGYGTGIKISRVSAEVSNDALNLNEWYKVKHIFNTINHTETLTVTPEGSSALTVFENAEISSLFDGVYQALFAAENLAVWEVDNIKIENKAITMTGLGESYDVNETASFNAIVPGGFSQMRIKSAGQTIETINTPNETGSYKVTLEPGDFKALGNCEIRVEADYSGGLTYYSSKTVNTYAITSQTNKLNLDMSGFTADTDVANAGVAAGFSNNGTLSNANFYRYTDLGGKGAEDVSLGVLNNGTVTTSSSYLDKLSTNYTSGSLRVKFSFYESVGSEVSFLVREENTTGSSQQLNLASDESGGTYLSTIKSGVSPCGKWFDVTLLFDLTADKVYQSITDNQGLIYTKTASFTLSKINLLQFQISPKSIDSYAAIDDVSVDIIGQLNTPDVSFTNKDGKEIKSESFKDGKISVAASKINFTFNSVASNTDGNIKLFDNNGYELPSTVSIVGNTFSVVPTDALVKDTNYTINFGPDIIFGTKALNTNYTYNFTTELDTYIHYPINGSIINENIVSVYATAFDASQVELFVDGILVNTFAPAVDGVYSYDLNLENYGAGYRTVRYVVSYADGTKNLIESTVNYLQVVGLGTASKEVENYNSLDTIVNLSGKTFTSNAGSTKITLSRGAGKLGTPGDYSLLFSTPNGGDSTTYYEILASKFSNSLPTTGVFVLDFDMKLVNGTETINFITYKLWYNGLAFITGGKVGGTNVTVTKGLWYHFNLKLDIDKGLWYITMDGNTIVNGVSQSNSSQSKYNNIRLTQAKSTTGTGIYYDNISCYQIAGNYPTNISYVENSVITETTSKIPKTASDINITLNSSLTSIANADVEVKVNEILTEHGGVSIAGNVVTVKLPLGIKENSKVEVRLKNSNAGINNDIPIVLYTTNFNGSYFKTYDSSFSDSVIDVTLETSSITNTTAVLIVASYEGNKLSSVEKIDLTVTPESKFVNASITAHEAATSAKIFIWDSLTGLIPLSEPEDLGIN